MNSRSYDFCPVCAQSVVRIIGSRACPHCGGLLRPRTLADRIPFRAPAWWTLFNVQALLILTGVACVYHDSIAGWYDSLWMVAAVPLVALCYAGYEGRRRLYGVIRAVGSSAPTVPIPVLAVLGAMAVRGVIHYYVPMGYTLYEEEQTGNYAYDILARGHSIQVHFRYTNLVAALGFHLGEYDLASLRSVYYLISIASVGLFAAVLRALNIGWAAALVATYAYAATGVLAMASAVADEYYTGMFWAMLLMLLVLASRRDGCGKSCAALAGVVAGMLWYEHDVFIGPVALACGWFAWEFARRRSVAPPVVFVVFMSLSAFPVMVDLARNLEHPVVASGLARNVSNKFATGPGFDWEVALTNFRSYMGFLFGIEAWGGSVSLNMNKPGSTAVPVWVGGVMACACLFALAQFRRHPWGALSVVVIGMAVALLVTVESGIKHQRMVFMLPFLMMLTAAVLDRFAARIPSPAMVAVVAVMALCLSVHGVWYANQWRHDPEVASWMGWGNERYMECRAMNRPVEVDTVFIEGAICLPHEQWIYDRLQYGELVEVDSLPYLLEPGQMAVLGTRSYSLSESEVERIIGLAVRSGAAGSIHAALNLNGDIVSISACRECPTVQ